MNLPSKMNKAQRELYESWVALGFEIDDGMIAELWTLGTGTKKPPSVMEIEREAELVLLSLRTGTVPLTMECKLCRRKYQTNYQYNKYCSNDCRAIALSELGIKWDEEKSESERWYPFEPPSTIRPETYQKLLKWAEKLLDRPIPTQPVEVSQESGPDTSTLSELDDLLHELGIDL